MPYGVDAEGKAVVTKTFELCGAIITNHDASRTDYGLTRQALQGIVDLARHSLVPLPQVRNILRVFATDKTLRSHPKRYACSGLAVLACNAHTTDAELIDTVKFLRSTAVSQLHPQAVRKGAIAGLSRLARYHFNAKSTEGVAFEICKDIKRLLLQMFDDEMKVAREPRARNCEMVFGLATAIARLAQVDEHAREECQPRLFAASTAFDLNPRVRQGAIIGLGRVCCHVTTLPPIDVSVVESAFRLMQEALLEGCQPAEVVLRQLSRSERFKDGEVTRMSYAGAVALGLLVRSNLVTWYEPVATLFETVMTASDPPYPHLPVSSILLTIGKLGFYMSEDNRYLRAWRQILLQLAQSENDLEAEVAVYALTNWALCHPALRDEVFQILRLRFCHGQQIEDVLKYSPNLSTEAARSYELYLKAWCRFATLRYEPVLNVIELRQRAIASNPSQLPPLPASPPHVVMKAPPLRMHASVDHSQTVQVSSQHYPLRWGSCGTAQQQLPSASSTSALPPQPTHAPPSHARITEMPGPVLVAARSADVFVPALESAAYSTSRPGEDHTAAGPAGDARLLYSAGEQILAPGDTGARQPTFEGMPAALRKDFYGNNERSLDFREAVQPHRNVFSNLPRDKAPMVRGFAPRLAVVSQGPGTLCRSWWMPSSNWVGLRSRQVSALRRPGAGSNVESNLDRWMSRVPEHNQFQFLTTVLQERQHRGFELQNTQPLASLQRQRGASAPPARAETVASMGLTLASPDGMLTVPARPSILGLPPPDARIVVSDRPVALPARPGFAGVEGMPRRRDGYSRSHIGDVQSGGPVPAAGPLVRRAVELRNQYGGADVLGFPAGGTFVSGPPTSAAATAPLAAGHTRADLSMLQNPRLELYGAVPNAFWPAPLSVAGSPGEPLFRAVYQVAQPGRDMNSWARDSVSGGRRLFQPADVQGGGWEGMPASRVAVKEFQQPNGDSVLRAGGGKDPVPCRFWAQGRCAKGDLCTFSHQGRGGFTPGIQDSFTPRQDQARHFGSKRQRTSEIDAYSHAPRHGAPEQEFALRHRPVGQWNAARPVVSEQRWPARPAETQLHAERPHEPRWPQSYDARR